LLVMKSLGHAVQYLIWQCKLMKISWDSLYDVHVGLIRLTIAADLPGLILALHLGICYAAHLLVGAAVAFLAPTSHAYTIQQRHVLSSDGRFWWGGGELGLVLHVSRLEAFLKEQSPTQGAILIWGGGSSKRKVCWQSDASIHWKGPSPKIEILYDPKASLLLEVRFSTHAVTGLAKKKDGISITRK
jgi:hypothetical protein